jgi:hypothetical protein
LGWFVGQRLRAANSSTNWLEGPVTAVNGTSVTINSDLTGGSGTFTSWSIGIQGERGATGATGPTGSFTPGSTVQFGAGTVSAPSITTTDDTNTGIYFPAADTIAFAEGGVESGRLSSDGYLGLGITSPVCKLDVVGGIQTSRTGVTSPAATDGNIFSGTYTPTLTNGTNVNASTAYTCQYMRVGNVVTVSGRVDIDPGALQDTTLGVSLPIASNFSANENLGGTFVCQASNSQAPGAIYADATNDRATFFYKAQTSAISSFSFTFTYRVI